MAGLPGGSARLFTALVQGCTPASWSPRVVQSPGLLFPRQPSRVLGAANPLALGPQAPPVAWGSTMKKRRTKMNNHKVKKRRKKLRMKSGSSSN
eukprot:CAMPEP_0118982318 /NCGR_PEP_ID=MMETSP1173-20130426/32529_1 /TAXON_ID=1034831 /ORGANISM="Rhizochromulina marina cf, Strain CCMP1243" /LENGTH=93 /DNA_ID=CAMNT_0006932799 /DNA_START=21 /DNA_END=302 /DNA_ORIENTATION=-